MTHTEPYCSDLQERGSYYARYSDEYNQIERNFLHVAINLKRRFPANAVSQCEKPVCDDPRVIDGIDFSFDGDCKAYLSAAKDEDRKVKKFRSLCERTYPILKKMDFDFGPYGSLIWMGWDPKGELYEQWRSNAWAMWQDMPQLAKELDLVIKDKAVEPLPGPWKMRFL